MYGFKGVFLPVLCLLLVPAVGLGQQMVIGADNAHPSAALDVQSPDKGAIFPRVSLIDVTNGLSPVNGPETGLLIYNTNASVTGGDGTGYYYWEGSRWVKLITDATRNVESYGAYATRTYINSTSFIQVTGLSLNITLSGNAMVIITTNGSMETTSGAWGGSGCIVQVFQDGSALTNAFQTVDINDAVGVINTILPWAFTSFVSLGAGSYTFDVRARKYAFDNFYAGGNFTAPNPNEGSLSILVIYL